jgi:hypothetical protein
MSNPVRAIIGFAVIVLWVMLWVIIAEHFGVDPGEMFINAFLAACGLFIAFAGCYWLCVLVGGLVTGFG